MQIIRIRVIAFAATIVLAGKFTFAQDAAPLSVKDLNERAVIGALGQPLGKVVDVEAEIISGDSLRVKAYQSKYLLKITHVRGEKLDEARTIEFSAPRFARAKLASDPFALYELKNGKKAESLKAKSIEELEKDYVGKKVRLVVYEVGKFSGIPADLPEDAPIWADLQFHFSTSLVVLAERE